MPQKGQSGSWNGGAAADADVDEARADVWRRRRDRCDGFDKAEQGTPRRPAKIRARQSREGTVRGFGGGRATRAVHAGATRPGRPVVVSLVDNVRVGPREPLHRGETLILEGFVARDQSPGRENSEGPSVVRRGEQSRTSPKRLSPLASAHSRKPGCSRHRSPPCPRRVLAQPLMQPRRAYCLSLPFSPVLHFVPGERSQHHCTCVRANCPCFPPAAPWAAGSGSTVANAPSATWPPAAFSWSFFALVRISRADRDDLWMM